MRLRSASSASSPRCSFVPRSVKRSTSSPRLSMAAISRRMKVWLTFGYWLTR